MGLQKITNFTAETMTNTTISYTGSPLTISPEISLALQGVFTVNTPSNKTFETTDVNTTADTITITAHGFTSGLKVTFTTTGTLPAGLALATTYSLIVVDANTIRISTNSQGSIEGLYLDLTSIGTGTGTVTVTALAGVTFGIQKSNDLLVWITDSSASITASGTLDLSKIGPGFLYARSIVVVTSGRVSGALQWTLKGFA